MNITDDEITSALTRHHATHVPKGWVTTWTGDRTLTLSQARDAIELAEAISTGTDSDRATELAHHLGLTTDTATQLITTNPPH